MLSLSFLLFLMSQHPKVFDNQFVWLYGGWGIREAEALLSVSLFPDKVVQTVITVLTAEITEL